jgi:acid phosphatase family membrane protein YuiD
MAGLFSCLLRLPAVTESSIASDTFSMCVMYAVMLVKGMQGYRHNAGQAANLNWEPSEGVVKRP